MLKPIPFLPLDIILVRTQEREPLIDALAFALDYITPKEPIASDPSVPAELSRVRACVVLGPSQGWVAVCLSPLLREDDIVEKVARLLSLRVGGSLQLAVGDGALLYELYQKGEMIHSYCTNESLPEFRLNPPLKEQAEELVSVLELSDPSVGLPKLSKAIQPPTEGWGEEIFRELSKLLALPPEFSVNFESLWEEGLLDAAVGKQRRAVCRWKQEPMIYLEADSFIEAETTAKRWLH
jgi:hypothetical protein